MSNDRIVSLFLTDAELSFLQHVLGDLSHWRDSQDPRVQYIRRVFAAVQQGYPRPTEPTFEEVTEAVLASWEEDLELPDGVAVREDFSSHRSLESLVLG